jgi:hypothetical protein
MVHERSFFDGDQRLTIISSTEHPGLFRPARRMCALHSRPFQVGAEHGKPVDRERRHRGFAILGEIGCQLAGDLNHAEARARHIGKQRCGARVCRFLKYKIIAPQPERIAGKLDRYMLIAAEAELADRLGLARGQGGLKSIRGLLRS